MPVKMNTFYTANRQEWRGWLKKHYKSSKEIWLVYYKKHTNRPRIPYNEAVEEALCFGWIDSQVRRIDKDQFAQKFSPRNPRSSYSQANIERLRKLIKQKKVAKEIVTALGDILKVKKEKFIVPPDILKSIKSNPVAWQNFKKFSPSYVRIRVAFINGARNRPLEFAKRLRYFIRMSEKNKLFGFGGIEKYY
jgi:uncharacterized protein YdeI (YjbR/CyaY-like superfamily)